MKILVITLIRSLRKADSIPAIKFIKSLSKSKNHTFEHKFCECTNIMAARNMVCQKHLDSDFDYLWMWDSDQEFNIEQAEEMVDVMVNKKIHILTPWIQRQGRRKLLNMGTIDKDNSFNYLKSDESHGFREIDFSAEGALMISMESLKATSKEEWFHPYKFEKDGVIKYSCWDYGFCLYMRSHGFKLYLDDNFKANHVQKRERKSEMDKETKSQPPKNLLEYKEASSKLDSLKNDEYVRVYNHGLKLQLEIEKLKSEVGDKEQKILELETEVKRLSVCTATPESK